MVAVGVGGYASGPTLNVCASKGIPCLLQEQNSYAGVTNKILAKKASKICVAYDNMERFFPADHIIKTGNPVRQNVLNSEMTPAEARKKFGLDPEKRQYFLLEEVSVHVPLTKVCSIISILFKTVTYNLFGKLENIIQRQSKSK